MGVLAPLWIPSVRPRHHYGKYPALRRSSRKMDADNYGSIVFRQASALLAVQKRAYGKRQVVGWL